MPQEPLLELNQASVVRSGCLVLNKISLQIPLGRHTAILGPNGSGKSTLIKLITRDLYPLHEEGGPPIRILGRDRWEISQLRSQLGLVSRDMERALEEGDSRSGLEVVLSGFFSTHAIYKHTQVSEPMREAALDALDLLGAKDLAHKPVTQMSSGEARRVLIARALAPDPNSLILDEPTAGLDIVARRSFLERLRLVANSGKTIVMITHHIEEIIPEIDWIILLKGGQIAAQGKKNEVLTATVLSGIFGAKLLVSKRGHYFSSELQI